MKGFTTRIVGTIFYLNPIVNLLLSLILLICCCVTNDPNVLISLMILIIIFSVVHVINFVIARKMETGDFYVGFWIYNIALCLLDFILLHIALSQLVTCSSYWKIDDPNVCLLIFINSLYSLIISFLFSMCKYEYIIESKNKLIMSIIDVTFLSLILNLRGV